MVNLVWMSLTYTTDDLITLFDGAGFKGHTTEACWLGGFWGVSVNNQLLITVQLAQIIG